MNYIRNINKYLYILVFTLVSTVVGYAQSVNAGGKFTTCGTEYTLQGSTDAGDTNGITWSVVSKPEGATDPVFSNPSILKPNVTGMNKPGDYVFKLTKVNAGGTTVSSQVVITSTGDTSTFTAGSDILTIPATTGTVQLNGVIPEGFTGEWRAENFYYKERLGQINSANSTFNDKKIANPIFSLIKKADHDVDPSYRVYLKITSNFNSNCTYEKSIIVRFIPNPYIKLGLNREECSPVLENDIRYIFFDSSSPKFDTRNKNVSGNSNFGTTITLNIISQPVGGNMEFLGFGDGDRGFIKLNAIGIYKFTLTISNSIGTYTTDIITYNKTGVSPGEIKFKNTNSPEQEDGYGPGGSGGRVFCNYQGSNTPITIYYTLDEKDNPALIESKAIFNTLQPAGGTPSIELFGANQRERYIIVKPPLGGWRIGTYDLRIDISNGGCKKGANFYIHISDGKREDIKIDDIVVCYPGSGTVDTRVQLPPVFKGIPDPSYLQDHTGEYFFELISNPVGASNPNYELAHDRVYTNTSTLISNLDKPGEYIFKVILKGRIESVEWVLDREFACSGASRETTFKVIVSEQVGSNAGSDQNDLYCRARTVLVGNDPGAGQGKWTVESAPVGMTPTFSDDTNPRTIVAGLDITGTYRFTWTITTGDCISASTVEVITDQDNCKKPLIITNPTTTSKTIKRKK